jgi:hypothetical protein
MPTVRTTCPTCGTIVIDVGGLLVRRRRDIDHCECVFTCPLCEDEVVQALSDRMVPVLIGAGCLVDDWGHETRSLHPSMTGAITESEIDEFVQDLDRDDWFEELLV